MTDSPDLARSLDGLVERHPWNRDFTWSLPAGAPTILTAEQKARFDRDGYLVLTGVVDRETLAEVTADLDELEAEVDRYLASTKDGRKRISERGAITFTTHAVVRSAAARRATHDPTLVGVAGDLVGPDVNLYWDQAVYKKPEKPRRFPWHQDNGYTYCEPQQYLTFWMPLVDATIDNGCPWVLPGGHRAGTLLHHWVDPIGWECLTEPEGAVPAEVPTGGVSAEASLGPRLASRRTSSSPSRALARSARCRGARRRRRTWRTRWDRSWPGVDSQVDGRLL